MINLNQAINEFNLYLNHFDLNNSQIKLKIKHTYHVMNLCKEIAEKLNLTKQEILLAQLIGLLHDIGRFEQIKRQQNFNDTNILDHAELGLNILTNNNYIRKYIVSNDYDNIIFQAILNHNKFKIADNLTSKELLFAQIVRDADKIDNFRVECSESFEDMFGFTQREMENSSISPKVYQDFKNYQVIINEDRQTPMDYWLSCLALVFDLNFSISFHYIVEHNYLDTLFKRIKYQDKKTKQIMKKIKKQVLELIDLQ